jgi:alpha-D-ribose 1-methylphosphonate 5-triphosphate synthase subunit PhnH
MDNLEDVPQPQLEHRITELAALIAASTCEWLLLLHEFDRRRGYEAWENRSTSHWLNFHCGVSLPAARERVRVARVLPDFPDVVEAFSVGRLSYSKVRALTRIVNVENWSIWR